MSMKDSGFEMKVSGVWERAHVRVVQRDTHGAKKWLATAPGVSACGSSASAALAKLRLRATRLLEMLK